MYPLFKNEFLSLNGFFARSEALALFVFFIIIKQEFQG